MHRRGFLQRFADPGLSYVGTAADVDRAIVANLEAVLNTREGYGYFVTDFGIGGYEAFKGTREASVALGNEVAQEIGKYEPRIRNPVVVLLGRSSERHVDYQLLGEVGGARRRYVVRFDTLSTNFAVLC